MSYKWNKIILVLMNTNLNWLTQNRMELTPLIVHWNLNFVQTHQFIKLPFHQEDFSCHDVMFCSCYHMIQTSTLGSVPGSAQHWNLTPLAIDKGLIGVVLGGCFGSVKGHLISCLLNQHKQPNIAKWCVGVIYYLKSSYEKWNLKKRILFF